MTTRQRRLIGAVLAAALLSGAAWFRFHAKQSNEAMPALAEKDYISKRHQLWTNLGPAATVATQPLAADKTIRVAFGNLGFGEAKDELVADLAIVALTQTPGVEMVERQQLNSVLSELQLSLSGLVRAHDAVRAGKLARVDWFVLGAPYDLNGNSRLVLRVVDAHSGVVLYASDFALRGNPNSLAANLTAFVQRARHDVGAAKSPIYLALGGFNDLGVSERAADFPSELRARLVAAYRQSDVVLVEREFIDTLAREIALDEAGLTEARTQESSAQLQPALWLVEGSYQSYETTRPEVEVDISVDHIFGLSRQTLFRDVAGPRLFDDIKKFIDKTMREEASHFTTGRDSEARWEIKLGRRLVEMHDLFGPIIKTTTGADRDLAEATRAFKAALLLDPTNRQARFYLASCFESTGQIDDARELYRQILDEGANDQWKKSARLHLTVTWNNVPPATRLSWYQNAERLATNAEAGDFYRQEEARAGDATSALNQGPDSTDAAKRILFDTIQNHISRGHLGPDWGAETYVNYFQGEARAAAIASLESFLPQIKQDFPEAYPFLLGDTILLQSDTNALVVNEFEQSFAFQLDDFAKKTNSLQRAVDYTDLLNEIATWASEHTNHALAARVLAGMRDSHIRGLTFSSDQRMNLAFALEKSKQWQAALDTFESYSNRPVRMGNKGIYGPAFSLVFPHVHCANCRRELGLPAMKDARGFAVSDNNIKWRQPFAFDIDDTGLWVGAGNQLFHLTFDLNTNGFWPLPCSMVSCVFPTPDSIWVGTADEGLLAFDRKTKSIRRWTEKDGLLMNSISALMRSGQDLWIGYGNRLMPGRRGALDKGGLGRLDIDTGQIESFVRSMADGAAVIPDGPIWDIATAKPDEIWLATGGNNVVCFRKEKSKRERFRASGNAKSLAIIPGSLFVVGNLANTPLGLGRLDISDRAWHNIVDTSGPEFGPAGIVRIANGQVWIGGVGYVASIDPHSMQITRFAYVNAANGIDDLHFGSGMICGQYDNVLFQAEISP